MEFFKGFQWALPVAFADSLARAWFVEGDVLYDSAEAYNASWSAALQAVEYTIQVRSPARSSEVNNQTVREVFTRNWHSEVRLDLYSHMTRVGNGQVRTTQGRLYTSLWKGTIDTLFEDKSAHPPVPTTAQQLSRDLEKASGLTALVPSGHATFVMVRDLSNSVSRSKYQKVQAKLRPYMSREPVIVRPADANFPDAHEIAPTVDIALFPTTGVELSELEELVKQAVYVPTRDAKKDMFRLSAHGVVI